ncbi:MAG: lipopolysaccharide transport periplasmic protein LptA [Psychromonas sp.]|nr:lipopolysaccharide transport periplasmic protein LptA [Psychromonas sp.]
MKKNKIIIILISTITLSFSSLSLKYDRNQPIHISSQSQHAIIKKNIVIFWDDVLLTQGNMKLTANKLTVNRGSKTHNQTILAEGNPATFYRLLDTGKPVNAKANSIYYDVSKEQITLIGNAQIKQLTSEVNGEKIIYYLHNEELIVKSGKGRNKRVETVLLPSQFKKQKNK